MVGGVEAGGGCVEAAGVGVAGNVNGVPTWSVTTVAAANGSASAAFFDGDGGSCVCLSLTTGMRWRTVFERVAGVVAVAARCCACLRGGSGARRCTFGTRKSGKATFGSEICGNGCACDCVTPTPRWRSAIPIGPTYAATSTRRPRTVHQ